MKMAYDHPFNNNRDNQMSPHVYLDLDIGQQTTFMNKTTTPKSAKSEKIRHIPKFKKSTPYKSLLRVEYFI